MQFPSPPTHCDFQQYNNSRQHYPYGQQPKNGLHCIFIHHEWSGDDNFDDIHIHAWAVTSSISKKLTIATDTLASLMLLPRTPQHYGQGHTGHAQNCCIGSYVSWGIHINQVHTHKRKMEC